MAGQLEFGLIPYWAICGFSERSKIEIVVFSAICSRWFRDTQEAECSRAEIEKITGLDKSQISRAIKLLESINWIKAISKTRWVISKKAPEVSVTVSEKVAESSTKVAESSTKSCRIVNKSGAHIRNTDQQTIQTNIAVRPQGVKRQAKAADSRSKHPAIQVVRSLMGRYPEKVLWDRIIDRFGDKFNKDKLEECCVAWMSRGYNPNALTWLNWYFDGIPEKITQNGGYKNNAERRLETINDTDRRIAELLADGESEHVQSEHYGTLETYSPAC